MKTVNSFAVASPSSNAGKTVVTLGLLRLLSRKGVDVRAAKSGPDFIDPQFHLAACGQPSVNLDAWAMDQALLRQLATHGVGATSMVTKPDMEEFLIIEGAMGVLDGAGKQGKGCVAELAEHLGVPIVLVIDARALSHSAVLPALGLAAARPTIKIAGIIANRVASERHTGQIKASVESHGLQLLGAVKRRNELTLPSRHLGLVQAAENPHLDEFLEFAADCMDEDVDIDALLHSALPLKPPSGQPTQSEIPPLGQRIAVAKDTAFGFSYPHVLENWRRAGAEVSMFSPLSNEAPKPGSDAIYLPGGYPELYAGKLASASRFKAGMKAAARKGSIIYGECGGYMVLGRFLEDAEGIRHNMLNLLNHSTSFKDPSLHLRYINLEALPGAPFTGRFAGHEFHYANLVSRTEDAPLFRVADADGNLHKDMGSVQGKVSGSFAHLISSASQSL